MRINPNTTNNFAVEKTSPLVKLYLLPPILKLVLILFIFIVVVIGGFFILQQQATTEMKSVTQRKEVIEKEVMENAQSYGELTFLSKNKPQALKEYEMTAQQFPTEMAVANLLASITRLGTQNGLKFIYFKPQTVINNEYYASVPVDISVVGHFHHIGVFLSDIANLPRSVVDVNQFTLTPVSETDRPAGTENENLLTLQFTATLYYILPGYLDIKR